MKLIYNYLIKEKKKSIIIILTIMAMVTSIVCVGNFVYGLRNCQNEYVKSINGYYEYHFAMSKDNLEEISNSKEYQAGILQYVANTEEPVPIQLMACDENFLQMNHIRLKDGVMPTNSKEIVVEEWVLNNLGDDVTIGDEITFQNTKYTICGILTDSFYKARRQMNAFTTFLNNSDSEVYILFNNKKNISGQMADLANKYKIKNETIAANWDVLESEGTKAPIGKANNNILGYLKNISINEYDITVVWSLLAAFMIYCLYYLSIFKRENDYGVLKALGYSRFRFFGNIVGELVILFLIGALPGYYLGKEITEKIYIRIMSLFLSSDITIAKYQENTNIIILGCTVIIVLFFAIAAVISQKIVNSKSADLLRKKEGVLLKKRRILSKRKSNTKYNIALRYITTRRALLLLIILSLSIGNILFVTVEYGLRQLKEQKISKVQLESGFDADYKIQIENTDLDNGITRQDLAAIKNIPGIDETLAFRYTLGAVVLKSDQYPNKDYFKPENDDKRLRDMTGGICTEETNGSYLLRTNVWGYDRNAVEHLKKYLIDGEIDFQDIAQNRKAIVRLSMSGTGKYDNVLIKPGDFITIKIPKIDFYDKDDILKFDKDDYYSTMKVEVAATIKDVPTKNKYFIGDSGIDIVLANSVFSQQTKIVDFNQVEAKKTTGSELREINSKLNSIVSSIKNASYVNYTIDIERSKANYTQQLLLFAAISIAIVLSGFLYVANCARHLIYAWRHEFSMLRAIGLADRDLYKMMAFQSLVYSGASFIVTCILCLLGMGVVYVLYKDVLFYYNVKYAIDWQLICGLGGINLLICLFIMIGTTRKLINSKRLDITKM